MPAHDLTEALRSEAIRLGFCHVGVCGAVEPPGFGRLEEWLQAGYGGQMHYLADRLDSYRHPEHVLAGAKSLMVLATDYCSVDPEAIRGGEGRLARYAWGLDYHDVLHERLNCLAEFHRKLTPGAQVRGVVDTAPLMEREFAVLAGVGWIGKNTLLLTRERGSWLFLSVLLTTVELEYNKPFPTNHCGTCRACVDACPTGALVAPRILDARRCISYLTIELRGLPPSDLREASGDWLFGCDICQDVCPWNRRRSRQANRDSGNEQFLPFGGETFLDLIRLFSLDDEGFRSRFRKTPLWRAKRRGLLRNGALILGCQRPPGAVTALVRGLNDREPLVRASCAWALGRIGDVPSAAGLRERLALEADADVCDEIRRALGLEGSVTGEQ